MTSGCAAAVSRQARIRLYEPHVVLARMLDSGDVENGRLARRRGDAESFSFARSRFPVPRQPVVEHRNLIFAAVPVLHHVRLGGGAHRDKMLRLLRIVRQDVREVEHPQARVLAGNVEIREIVHRRRGRKRIERAHAPVRRADDEAVELAAVAADPERQHQEVPQHRQRRPPRPAGRKNDSRNPRTAGKTRAFPWLAQKRQFVSLRGKGGDDLPDIDRDAALAAVVGHAGNEQSHDGGVSPKRARSLSPVTGLEMILANRLMS